MGEWRMSLPKTIITKLDPQKLKDSFFDLPNRAKKKKWVLLWDKLTDSLYFVPKVIPRDNILFSVTHELNVYVNVKSEINGIFIENFSANFVKHNTDFRELPKALNKKVEDDTYTPSDKNKSELYAKALEASLIESIGDKSQLSYPEFLGA